MERIKRLSGILLSMFLISAFVFSNGFGFFPIEEVQACSNPEPSYCELELTKEGNVDSVEPGDEITYTLTLTNTGTADCTGTGVLIKDYFDENTSYLSSSRTPKTKTSTYVEWNMGTLHPQDVVEIDLVTEVSEETECDTTLINKAKYWSNQTDWSDFIVEETMVECPPVEEQFLTIVAYKVVCEEESYLPDWAKTSGSPSMITETLITDYVGQSCGKCWFEEGWEFEWGEETATKKSGTHIGYGGTGWNTFGPTDINGQATVEIDYVEGRNYFWVREVLKEGYIPFSDAEGGQDSESAEMLCHVDAYKYDNYDRVDNPEAEGTYYCVAFNVQIPVGPIPGCTDEEALNYNPNATEDDGSCEYPEPEDIFYTLTVTKTGSGTVTGPNISCGTDCTEDYLEGTEVTLTASASSGYKFSGWSGACSGTGNCVVIMDGNKTVTAKFTRRSTGGGGTTFVEPEGEVLGEEIEEPEVCGIYLYEYIKYGANNNPFEVTKLQLFLNEHMNSNLAITGIYDLATMNAVNTFQLQYKEQVLKPWVDVGSHCNVNQPTGYVYITTQRWINLIMCPTLNLPMPDLSMYEKADCSAYFAEREILSEQITIEEDVSSDDELEEESPEDGILFQIPEIEESKESQVCIDKKTLWVIIAVIATAIVGTAWIVYNAMKKSDRKLF